MTFEVVPERTNAHRFLRVYGERVYDLGTTCPTCPFLYGRMQNATPPVAPERLTAILRNGLTELNPSVIDTVSLLLPSGSYQVGLLLLSPRPLPPRSDADFHKWHYGEFQSDAYLGAVLEVDDDARVFEIVNPLFSRRALDSGAIKDYIGSLQAGRQPTALALSVLESRHPMAGSGYSAPDWAYLVHYLIDGHHKVMAASQLGSTVRLLSFWALSEGGLTTTHPHNPSIQDVVLQRLYN